MAGGRESCKQIATLNPRPGSAERPGSLCLQGSLKCVESGEGEHPDGGPPGPRPPPGAASAQPRRRAWALALCTPLPFMFTEKERERRERSLWLPSSDHKYCKLQMAAPLPNSAHTASPDAMERAAPAALTTCTPLPTTPGEGRDGECCPALLPKPPSPRPGRGTPREVQGGAGFARRGAELCWFLNVGLLCRDHAASPLPGPAWLLRVEWLLSSLPQLPLPLVLTARAPPLPPRFDSHAAARL